MRFYEANPDEELSYQDAATKMGVSRKYIYARASELVASGDFESITVLRMTKRARLKFGGEAI